MTTNITSAVTLNESLEQIEFESANIRLSLMERDISEVVNNTGLWETGRVYDSIAIYDPNADAKFHFGMLVGYFDECWWCGIVLFNSDDLSVATADELQKVSNMLSQSGVKISLKSDYYVYADCAGSVECEDFSEFMPKMLQKIDDNNSLLYEINGILSKLLK